MGVPTSADEFERLLVGSPNSSLIWIQYMSFQTAQSEVDQARSIAERALETINFREEQEKENVWLAYIKLEHQFGDEKAVKKVKKQMLSGITNRKNIHLKLAEMYEMNKEYELAEKEIKSAIKVKKHGYVELYYILNKGILIKLELCLRVQLMQS